MQRKAVQRSFPECDILATIVDMDEPPKEWNDVSCILELWEMAFEAIDAALEPEIEIVEGNDEEPEDEAEVDIIIAAFREELDVAAPDWTAIDEAWFSAGLEVERLLRRQGMDSSTGDELDVKELAALVASENSRR